MTTKETWDTLKKKYIKIRPLTNRHYLQQYVNYRKKSKENIKDAWIEIQRLKRWIKTTNDSLKTFTTQHQMFQQLFVSFSLEYDIVQDVIDNWEEHLLDVEPLM